MSTETDEDTTDTMGALLKLANEAGGRIDPHKMARRPPTSLARCAYERALSERLVNDAGYITPPGYRWLGDWAIFPELHHDSRLPA